MVVTLNGPSSLTAQEPAVLERRQDGETVVIRNRDMEDATAHILVILCKWKSVFCVTALWMGDSQNGQNSAGVRNRAEWV